jgi:hypothetical protein
MMRTRLTGKRQPSGLEQVTRVRLHALAKLDWFHRRLLVWRHIPSKLAVSLSKWSTVDGAFVQLDRLE